MTNEEYASLSNSNLLKNFEEQLAVYKNWVDKQFELNNGWLEEIEYLSFTRSELHKIIEELEKRSLNVDSASVRDSDAKWQAWAIANTDPNFSLEHPRDDQPKEFWWEWIDQLGALTPEQRSTL